MQSECDPMIRNAGKDSILTYVFRTYSHIVCLFSIRSYAGYIEDVEVKTAHVNMGYEHQDSSCEHVIVVILNKVMVQKL